MTEENKNQDNSVNNSVGSENQTNAPSGGGINTGGEGATNNNNTVTYEAHRKLLDEKKKIENKLRKIEEEKEKSEKEKLAKDGEYQKLLDMEKKTNETLKESVKKTNLKLLAFDFHDPSDILSFYNQFNFDEDMNVINSDDVLKELKEKKPYLFKSDGGNGKINTNTTPPKGFSPNHKFTENEISKMDSETFEKNRTAILQQMAANGGRLN